MASSRTLRRQSCFEQDEPLIKPALLHVARRPNARTVDRARCPLQCAAMSMVKRALASEPELVSVATRPSATIVIEVPHAEWVDEIAEAWRHQVQRTDDVPDDGDGHEPLQAKWVEFRRAGGPSSSHSRAQLSGQGNSAVQAAVAFGKAVYGFSPDPARLLPSDLVRCADRRIRIQPLDGRGLRDAISAFCGKRTNRVPTDEEARLVMPADLLLAVRPDRDPEAMIQRVVAFARTRAKDAKAEVRLADLHGMDEAVAWGRALLRDLRDFQMGSLPWSAVDRGAVVAGPTGTGKTTFAQALSRESGLPLVIGSVAAWQASGQGYLGDMLKAMRETFTTAKALAPCILFIDELDSLGDRDSYEAHNRNYGVQVVNAFLELVDGMDGREGVVALGATNRPNALDPAILRPGRLDQVIPIGLPDATALAGIFRHHLGEDLPGVGLSDLAHRAVGHTGAVVERWIRSARRTARHQGRPLEFRDLDMQVPDREADVTPETLWRVAVHEAGHALVISILRPGALQSVSLNISDREASIGNVEWLRHGPEDTEQQVTRESLLVRLAEILAGRAAEVVILGQPSAGAGGPPASDLAQATWMSTMAVTAFGLDGDGGFCPSLWRGLTTPERVPALLSREPDIAARAGALLAEAHETALHIIDGGRRQVERIARRLLETRSMTGDEVEALLVEAQGLAGSKTAAAAQLGRGLVRTRAHRAKPRTSGSPLPSGGSNHGRRPSGTVPGPSDQSEKISDTRGDPRGPSL